MFKRKKLIFVFVILIIAGLSASSFLRRNYVVPILMYHSVASRSQNALTVSSEAFERQMRFLKTHKYNVVTLEALADLVSRAKNIPPRTVAITLDDGYKNNYTNAFPVLKKYGLKATEFIIVNEVSRAQGDRLSWEEIKEMRDSGLVTIGCHTLGPEPLIDIRQEDLLRSQIFDSKRILEEKLGGPVEVFSYPGGMFNAHIRKLVIDAGFKVAVSTNPGRNSSPNDIYALKRLRISENSKNMFIFWFESSGIYTFIKEHKRKK